MTYSTLYLEQISEQLGRIAEELGRLNVNGEKTILELQGITHALASKT
jgi:hypothetical protein